MNTRCLARALASRIPQSRLTAPASVTVITSEEIRQSGAITLPEVLRMVPGVHVAQIDGNKWAMGIRGFTDSGTSLFVQGRNLHQPGHPEFTDGANGTFRIQRALVVGLRWTR